VALTGDQISRGRGIRELLTQGIDFARENGKWPIELRELKLASTADVSYLGPPEELRGLERHLRAKLKSVAAVCHESLSAHPDGVWVGYADGHIELVHDATGLKSAISQFKPARPLIEKMAEPIAPGNQPVPKADAKLTLRLIDESGQPVRGARIEHFLLKVDYDPTADGRLLIMDKDLTDKDTIADGAGKIEVQYRWFFWPDEPADSPAPLASDPLQIPRAAVPAPIDGPLQKRSRQQFTNSWIEGSLFGDAK
jgi:hypothetical protein